MSDNLYIKSLDWTRIDFQSQPLEFRNVAENIQNYPIQRYETSYPQNLYWIKLNFSAYNRTFNMFAIPAFWVREIEIRRSDV